MKIARINTYGCNRLGLSRVFSILGLVACLCAPAFVTLHRPERSSWSASAQKPVPVTITWEGQEVPLD